jgi:predicted transposase YbfD/YdcC
MSSSLTTVPVAAPTPPPLLAVLPGLVDPRHRQGRRYPLAGLVAAGIAATVAGARSFTAIAAWLADQDATVAAALGLDPGRRTPSESVFRRLFARLDAEVLDGLVGVWMWTTTAVVAGRRVIAIDGKTVRGARAGGGIAPHLVAAFDHAAHVVLGQVAVAAKTNEIPTVRALLQLLDLCGAVVTIDAMHCQDDTAEAITTGGGDYVLTIKGNRPTLHAACKKLPWKHIPTHRYTEKTKGRRVTRTIRTVTVPDWVSFPGAVLLAQLRRTVTVKGKVTVEVVYVITSADVRPATLAAWVQGHWAIENKLHYVRDVAYTEDASRVRTGNAPRVMATLRGHRDQPAPPGRGHQHHRRPAPPPTPTRQDHHSPEQHKPDFAVTLFSAPGQRQRPRNCDSKTRRTNRTPTYSARTTQRVRRSL